MPKNFKNKKIPVDREKLERELARTGKSQSEISRTMGYSEAAISHAKMAGEMSPSMLNLLEHVIGIKYDDIKPDEPEPLQLQIEPEPTADNAATAPVYVTVQVDAEAVENAIMNILTNDEMRRNMSQIIYWGVKRALRGNV